MPTDMQNVTTETLSIGDLLSNRVPFQVPPYQRSYAWTSDELSDFVTDMLDIYRIENAGPQEGEPTDHFFGGLVSVQFEVATKIGHRFEVVDGQQRMTTFFVTLRLIEMRLRGIATREEGELANDAHESAEFLSNEFLRYRDREAGKSKWRTGYRLVLSRSDRDYFLELLEGKKPKPALRDERGGGGV